MSPPAQALLLLVLASCRGCACTPPAQRLKALAALPPPGPPGEVPAGLVLITVDTLRADSLAAYGHPQAVTPHFDRLSQGGVIFRQAIAQSTTTSPSHASLLTGLYVQDHSVRTNFAALGRAAPTLPELFAAAGYRTFALVNMRHLNPEVAHFERGFDTFVPSANMRRAAPTVDRFLAWLDGLPRGQSFFAWLHLADVHTPYRPPPPYDRLHYRADERDPNRHSLARIWPLLPTHMSDHPFFKAWLEGITDLAWVLAQYQGAVSYVDSELGHLLDALEARQRLRTTALVVTSDHGEALGEHDMYFVHTGLYEPTVRVPLLMWWPSHAHPGSEVHDVVELVDVLPTVAAAFHLEAPAQLRGRSLWPLMNGAVAPERLAFIEHAGGNQVALRSSTYKYIKHLRDAHLQPAYPFVAGREELYNLRDDPGESHNLAGERPAVLSAMRRALAARQRARLELSAGAAHINHETLDVLRSLGYVR